jgi:hypothetical protein
MKLLVQMLIFCMEMQVSCQWYSPRYEQMPPTRDVGYCS